MNEDKIWEKCDKYVPETGMCGKDPGLDGTPRYHCRLAMQIGDDECKYLDALLNPDSEESATNGRIIPL